MSAFEIPLVSLPQRLSVSMGGKTYSMKVVWNDKINCWVMDLSDANGGDILTGVPFVTGADLFEQFEYLGFGGQLVIQTDHNADAVPTFFNLGSTGHAYFVVPDA